ncbi:MAG: galactose-1-phosphate uridylyltransferase [Methanomicrobiales archaeon]|nr:galactose-1-phosphate uridylyltransferase [Methanomicrobiales archaeon]
MFSHEEIRTGQGTLQYRRDTVTGISCRISSERIKRGIDQIPAVTYIPEGCPFCPGRVEQVTPTFADGSRIIHGESVTFPNLFPFAAWHTVTVITREHAVERFTRQQLVDALTGQVESLLPHQGYASINWNFLPSSGASLAHPHLQGMVDRYPSARVRCYLEGAGKYQEEWGRPYWTDFREHERDSDRYLFGDDILWVANAVPVGEREVLGVLPGATLGEFAAVIPRCADGILAVIDLYRSLGTYAFNMSLFFDARQGSDFSAFCSMIARINPNAASLSDSSFMERLHIEPLILTSPEELAAQYRKGYGGIFHPTTISH